MARWPTAGRLACPSREPPAPQPGQSSPDCLPLGHRDPQGHHTSTLPGMPLISTDLSSSAAISFRIARIELFHYTDRLCSRTRSKAPTPGSWKGGRALGSSWGSRQGDSSSLVREVLSSVVLSRRGAGGRLMDHAAGKTQTHLSIELQRQIKRVRDPVQIEQRYLRLRGVVMCRTLCRLNSVTCVYGVL